MSASLTDTLCTRCGLCCDGSLFADVELASRAEATGLEILGLQIDDDDPGAPLLLQPCAALRGRRCTIYEHRPGCCRTFECRLLQEVRRGTVTVERAAEQIADVLDRIGQVEKLLVELGHGPTPLPLKERCSEALAEEPGGKARAIRVRTEIEAAMAHIDGVIRKTFL